MRVSHVPLRLRYSCLTHPRPDHACRYTLKRDEDVPAHLLDDPLQGSAPRSDINVVIERTNKRSVEVAGLKPNSAYRFTLQLMTSRSHSCDRRAQRQRLEACRA